MAQDPNENKADDAKSEKIEVPDFTGSWTLRTSDNLDDYLKAEGWGYIMRKAAAAVNAYQTITQDGDKIKVHVKNKKGEYEYEILFDGTECGYVDNDKDNVKATCSVVSTDDGPAIKEVMIKGKDSKKYVTYRYMKGGEMCLKITNAAHDKHTVRIFKKD